MNFFQRASKFLQSPVFPKKPDPVDLSISWGRLESLRKAHGKWLILWCMCQAMENNGFHAQLVKRSAMNKSTGVRMFDFYLQGCGLEYDGHDLDQTLLAALIESNDSVDVVVFNDETGTLKSFPEIVPHHVGDCDVLIHQVQQIMLPDLERGMLQNQTPLIEQEMAIAVTPDVAVDTKRRRL